MNAGPSASGGPPKTRRCPICGKPTVQTYRPFCSRRCADVDLHRWFSGSYAVPAAEQDDEAEELRDDGRADE
jgi:uncharacterized protein